MTELLGIMFVTVAIVVVVIVGLALYIIHYLLVRLPEQQRSILERFSPQITNQVLLEYAPLPQYQQKQIAEEKMRGIFEGQRIMPPCYAMIETAIANAMYKQKRKEADEWIEELKADQLAQWDTTEIKVTPKLEDMWTL